MWCKRELSITFLFESRRGALTFLKDSVVSVQRTLLSRIAGLFRQDKIWSGVGSLGKAFASTGQSETLRERFSYVCLILVLLIPVVMIPDGLYRFSLPKIALLCLAVVAGMAVPSPTRMIRSVFWLVAAALAVLLLAAVASAAPVSGILGRWPRYDGLILAVLCAGLVYVGVRTLGGDGGADSRRLWLRGTAVLMFVLAPLALAEALGARPLGGGADVRPGATLGNATDLGLVAMVGCLSLLPSALWTKKRLARAGAAAAALAAVSSGSRAVIAVLLLGAAILLGAKAYSARKSRRAAPAVVGGIGVLGLLIIAVWAIPATAARLFSTQTVDGRWLLWEGTLKLIRGNLVLGIGPGQFVDVFPHYQSETFARNVGTEFPADSPHMFPLEVLTVGGIPLFLTFAVLCIWIIILAFKRIRDTPAGENRLFLIGALAGVIGYGLALLTHFPSAGTVAGVCVLTGPLLAAAPRLSDRETTLQGRRALWTLKRAPLVAAAAVAVLACFVAAGTVAEVPMKAGYEAAARGETARAEKQFKQAQFLRPWDGDTPRLAAQAFAERTVVGDGSSGAAAVAWADAALERQPASIEAATARAIGKLGSGGTRDAVSILDEQVRRAPWTSELYLLRGLAKGSLGTFKEAIVDVERARELSPDPKRAMSLLADLYSAAGMPDKGDALRQEILKLDAR